MKWQEVRQHFPNQWLLLEAREGYSKDNQRVLENFFVIEKFDDGDSAWAAYRKARKQEPQREYLVLHTANPNYAEEEHLRLKESLWLGFRPTQ